MGLSRGIPAASVDSGSRHGRGVRRLRLHQLRRGARGSVTVGGGARLSSPAPAAHLMEGNVEGYLRYVGPAARSLHELIARERGTCHSPPARRSTPRPMYRRTLRIFANVPVKFAFTYKDVPADNKLSFTVLADFERQGTAWIEMVSAAADILPLWATGAVEATRSPHFLSLYRPGLADAARAIALAEEGRSRLLPRLTVVIDDVHVMTLAADAQELRTLLPRATTICHSHSPMPMALPAHRVDRHMVVDTERGGRGPGRPKARTDWTCFPGRCSSMSWSTSLMRYHSASLPGWVAEGAAMYLSEERRLAGVATPGLPAAHRGGIDQPPGWHRRATRQPVRLRQRRTAPRGQSWSEGVLGLLPRLHRPRCRPPTVSTEHRPPPSKVPRHRRGRTRHRGPVPTSPGRCPVDETFTNTGGRCRTATGSTSPGSRAECVVGFHNNNWGPGDGLGR